MKGVTRLIIFLYCFCHLLVKAADTLCSSPEGGGVWRSGNDLDPEGTRENGGKVEETSSYITDTANQCAFDCCSQLKGVCDVASYNSNQSKCSHYQCSPISKCKLYPNNNTDAFYPILSPGSDPELFNSTPTVTSSITTTVFSTSIGSKTSTRAGIGGRTSTSASIGDKVSNIASIGSTSTSASIGDSPISIDSTTITSTSIGSFTTMSRTSITTNPTSTDISSSTNISTITKSKPVVHGDGTKSKPRKGALPDELPLLDGPLKQDNTTIVARKGVGKSPDVSVGESEAGTVNEGRNLSFTDDQFTVSRENFPSSKATTNSLSAAAGQQIDVSSTFTTAKGITSTRFKTTEAQVINRKGYTNDFPTVARVTTVSPRVDFTAGSDVINSQSSAGAESPNFTLTGRGSAQLATESVTETVHHVVLNGTIVQIMQPTEHEVNSDTYQAFMNSDSLHLVIGLTLGLVLLLTVMGLIGRRVHDSWQRRHYSRMDFLIDGMYHGEA